MQYDRRDSRHDPQYCICHRLLSGVGNTVSLAAKNHTKVCQPLPMGAIRIGTDVLAATRACTWMFLDGMERSEWLEKQDSHCEARYGSEGWVLYWVTVLGRMRQLNQSNIRTGYSHTSMSHSNRVCRDLEAETRMEVDRTSCRQAQFKVIEHPARDNTIPYIRSIDTFDNNMHCRSENAIAHRVDAAGRTCTVLRIHVSSCAALGSVITAKLPVSL